MSSFLASIARRRRRLLLSGQSFGLDAAFGTLAFDPVTFATDETSDLTATDKNANDVPNVGVTGTLALDIGTVDVAASTLTSDVSTIESTSGEATLTATFVDEDGYPIPGQAATLASSGSNNTISADGDTDANGQYVWTLSSTTAEAKTLTASLNGLAITQTVAVTVSAAEGTVATVTDISRDAANADGGDLVVFTITTPSGLPSVTFDGDSATEITLLSSTQLRCRVPAHAAGVVDVVVGGVGFVNPRAALVGGDFEYLPVATTTFVDAGFETGSMPASLTTDVTSGSVSVVSTRAYSGTYSMRAAMDAGTSGNAYARNTTNLDIASETNGVYARQYVYIPAATLDNVQGTNNQIKGFLTRRQAGSGQPGWVVLALGTAASDQVNNDTFVIVQDNGTTTEARPKVAQADAWVEYLVWHKWNGSDGTVKVWINGKLYLNATDADYGGADTDYRARFGIAFRWSDGAVEMFVDEVNISNGFPAPVEV